MNKDLIKHREIVHDDRFDVDVKPYLSLGEIKLIGDKILATDNMCDANLIEDTLLLKICVPNEDFDGMDYDVLKDCGFIDFVKSHIWNIDDVYEYAYQKRSIGVQLSKFLDNLYKDMKKNNKKSNDKNTKEELEKMENILNKLQDIRQKG